MKGELEQATKFNKKSIFSSVSQDSKAVREVCIIYIYGCLCPDIERCDLFVRSLSLYIYIYIYTLDNNIYYGCDCENHVSYFQQIIAIVVLIKLHMSYMFCMVYFGVFAVISQVQYGLGGPRVNLSSTWIAHEKKTQELQNVTIELAYRVPGRT